MLARIRAVYPYWPRAKKREGRAPQMPQIPGTGSGPLGSSDAKCLKQRAKPVTKTAA
jgi:hypothetical protein